VSTRVRCRLASLVLAAGLLLGSAIPGATERLVASLSRHQVLITSSFTGTEIVLFGTVERDAQTVARASGYDIVVTIFGPRQTLVTRRKERVLGVWANVDSREFVDPASYLAVLATKRFDMIASPDVLRRQQVGINNIPMPQRMGTSTIELAPDDPFRVAFIRIKREQGLYREEPTGVTFLTPTLFRAEIPLPATVPIGAYEVDVKLFADGAAIARTNSAFEIIKVGFEQFVANAAREHGVLYGLATAAMALMTGWLASIVFRRD
jgi:uncharacterized protein (TIGR02186 family)